MKKAFKGGITAMVAVLLAASLLVMGCGKKDASESKGATTTKSAGGGKAASATDFTVTLYGDGIKLSDYVGKSKNVVIPAEIEGLPVVGINFEGDRKITSVTIPSTITSMQFGDCTNLKTVNFADGIQDITAGVFGSGAFAGCTSLAKINLPNGLKKIDSDAFSGCTALKSIIIPESVTYLYGGAFAGTGLTSIKIPDTIDEVRGSTFLGCESLASVTLGKNTREIGISAFLGCTSLKKIEFPPSIQWIGSKAFYKSGLTTVVIPDSVERIDMSSDTFAETNLDLASQVALQRVRHIPW
jgi:hypothetical protein